MTDARTPTDPLDATEGDYTLYAGFYTREGALVFTADGADTIPVRTSVIKKRP